MMLTLGANGFLAKRGIIPNTKCDPSEFFHIDVNHDLMKLGFDPYGIMKEDIILMNHDIIVGIPVYNEEKNISPLLFSLLEQNVKIREVIVVNDGSTDRTLNRITAVKEEIKHSLSIKIINLKENKGLSNALNLIFKEADSEHLIILPSDVILLEHDTLDKIMTRFDGDSDVGLICGGSKEEISSSFDVVARASRFVSFLFEKVLKERIKGKRKPPIWATGVVWGFPREVYKRLQLPVGLYRVDAYIYLCTISLNKKVIVVPEAKPVLKPTKTPVKVFIYRDSRTSSIPKKHIEVFGDLVKREFKESDLKKEFKNFAVCFVQHPVDGLSWIMLKTISYIYGKVSKPQVTGTWRTYEVNK